MNPILDFGFIHSFIFAIYAGVAQHSGRGMTVQLPSKSGRNQNNNWPENLHPQIGLGKVLLMRSIINWEPFARESSLRSSCTSQKGNRRRISRSILLHYIHITPRSDQNMNG